jgi:hypothetical protein
MEFNPAAMERLIARAFLTAHLLTAISEQAERVTREAINSWNPDEETEEVLFGNVLHASTRVPAGRSSSSKLDAAGSNLPMELQSVLKLEPQLRRCFVLRILVGLPTPVCAGLLHLPSRRVDEYTCAALRCLGSTRSLRERYGH